MTKWCGGAVVLVVLWSCYTGHVALLLSECEGGKVLDIYYGDCYCEGATVENEDGVCEACRGEDVFRWDGASPHGYTNTDVHWPGTQFGTPLGEFCLIFNDQNQLIVHVSRFQKASSPCRTGCKFSSF